MTNDQTARSGTLQMRVVLTTQEYAKTVELYRDTLGLTERESFANEHGEGIIFDAGSATLEILDDGHAAFVDSVEVGRRVAGAIRIGFEVTDVEATTAAFAHAGLTVVAPPVTTPWNSINSRVATLEGVQLTLFSERA